MASDRKVFGERNDAEAFIEKLIEDTNAERIEWVSCGDDVYEIPDVRLAHAGLLKLGREGILYTGRPDMQGDVRLLSGSIAASLDFYEGKDLVVIPHRSASARDAADEAEDFAHAHIDDAQDFAHDRTGAAQDFAHDRTGAAQDFDYFLIWEEEEGSHKTLLLTTSADGTGTLRRRTKELYRILFHPEAAEQI